MEASLFSHNDTQESASEVLKRTSSEQVISRPQFSQKIGLDRLSELEKEIGQCDAFFQSQHSKSGPCVYARIKGIDYVFSDSEPKPVETCIYINELLVTFDVQDGKLISVSDEDHKEIVDKFVKEWGLTENNNHCYHIKEQDVQVLAPDGRTHHCLFVEESAFYDDNPNPTYSNSLTTDEPFSLEYEDNDIDSSNIIELVVYSLAEGLSEDNWGNLNLSYTACSRNYEPRNALTM
jgi:hypothetical protein